MQQVLNVLSPVHRHIRGRAGEGEGLWEKIPQLSQFPPAATVPRLGSRALWFAEERELTKGWSIHLGPK